jgi:eukaryotic-like serine/threonine-protein kinase
MVCPEEIEIARFLDRGLVAARTRALEDHFDECDDCRQLVFALSASDSRPRGVGGGAIDSGAQLGRFEIRRTIAAGGMGVVYEAHDPTLRRAVALKVVRVGASPLHPDARARFLREAQSLARLDHPNVVTVYEVGEEGGEAYIAMELLVGIPLDRWLGERRRSWREVVAVLEAAGRGLAAAHAAGLVHRDVKPSNVMVTANGRVKVIDFGLVSAIGADAATAPLDDAAMADLRVTITGAVVGTPAYAAPEQLAGGEVGIRSDVFSFCVVLYEALFGRRPVDGPNRADALDRLELPARPRLPNAIRAVLRRGLASDPARRPASLDEILPVLAPAPRRRRVLAALAVAAAFAGPVVVLGARDDHERRACASAGAAIDRVWSPARRADVERAILATGVSYAPETWTRVERTIDDVATRWRAARIETCESSLARELVARRVACLDRGLGEVDAALAALAESDVSTVRDAQRVALGVPPPERCADTAATPRVPDPRAAATTALVWNQIARARAMQRLGRPIEAHAAATVAVAVAAVLAEPQLEAEARHVMGSAEDELGELAFARASHERAVWLAAAAGDARLEAQALSDLAIVADRTTRDDEVPVAYARHALAIAQRAGVDPLLEVEVRYALARVLSGIDNPAAAAEHARMRALLARVEPGREDLVRIALSDVAQLEAQLEVAGDRSIALLEEAASGAETVFGPDHPYVGAIVEQLALEAMLNFDVDGARRYAARASTMLASHPGHDAVLRLIEARIEPDLDRRVDRYRDIARAAEALHGPDHPLVAEALSDLVDALIDVAADDEAVALSERTIAILEASFGPRTPRLVVPLMNQAEAHLHRGDLDAGLHAAERARDLSADGRLGETIHALAALYVAKAYFYQRRYADALALIREHEAVVREAVGGDDPALAGLDFFLAACAWELDLDRGANLRRARAALDLYAGTPEADAADVREMNAWLSRH